MSRYLSIACIQYTSTKNEESTLKTIRPLIDKAVNLGSEFIALPECATSLHENSDITKELAKFNNIKFHDKEHIYYLDKVRTKSVTSIIGEYKHPFDKDYWSQKKADERGISKEEILKEGISKVLKKYDVYTTFSQSELQW